MNEEEIDRFARGELSAEESRALAQRALDNPDLFDELTALSVARAGSAPRPRKKRVWPWIVAAAAAVLLAVIVPAVWRPAVRAPEVAAVIREPLLLARAHEGAAVFRGDAAAADRAPRATGSVASIEDGAATIDLGSLDGLAKGGSVEVIRDGRVAGTISLDTIFRTRARGKAAGLALHAGDQVHVPDAAYLNALLDQIDALVTRGDSIGARRIAGQAARLAADAAAADPADLNNLAVIAELRGDQAKAESLYRQALAAAPAETARRSIEANLARLKEAK